MLNSVSASAVYGIADSLRWHANQQKVSGQIRTNNAEQLNVSNVAGSTGPSDDQEIKSNRDKIVPVAPAAAEQYWLDVIAARRTRVDGSPEAVKKSTPAPPGQYWLEAINSRRTRIDDSLEAVKQGKINPDRAVAQYRLVNEMLTPFSTPQVTELLAPFFTRQAVEFTGRVDVFSTPSSSARDFVNRVKTISVHV